jgi:hypothetical protein
LCIPQKRVFFASSEKILSWYAFLPQIAQKKLSHFLFSDVHIKLQKKKAIHNKALKGTKLWLSHFILSGNSCEKAEFSSDTS